MATTSKQLKPQLPRHELQCLSIPIGGQEVLFSAQRDRRGCTSPPRR